MSLKPPSTLETMTLKSKMGLRWILKSQMLRLPIDKKIILRTMRRSMVKEAYDRKRNCKLDDILWVKALEGKPWPGKFPRGEKTDVIVGKGGVVTILSEPNRGLHSSQGSGVVAGQTLLMIRFVVSQRRSYEKLIEVQELQQCKNDDNEKLEQVRQELQQCKDDNQELQQTLQCCHGFYTSQLDKMRQDFQQCKDEQHEAVSYTHLTLPTKRIV